MSSRLCWSLSLVVAYVGSLGLPEYAVRWLVRINEWIQTLAWTCLTFVNSTCKKKGYTEIDLGMYLYLCVVSWKGRCTVHMADKSRSDQQKWHPYIFVICISPGRSGFGLVGWSGWVVCADVCPTTKLGNSRHLWKCTPGIYKYIYIYIYEWEGRPSVGVIWRASSGRRSTSALE